MNSPDSAKVWVTPVATIDCPRCGKNVIMLGQDRCQDCNNHIYEVQIEASHKVLMDLQEELTKAREALDEADIRYTKLAEEFATYVADHEMARQRVREMQQELAAKLAERAALLSGLEARKASYERLIRAVEDREAVTLKAPEPQGEESS